MKLLQKNKSLLFGILSYLFSFAAYGDTTPIKNGSIHLDQSQDVLFEEFDPSTYALQLLQAKNQFKLHDLILGGEAQFDYQHWQGDKIEEFPPTRKFYQQGSGVYFTQATLDAMSRLTNWSTLFLSGTDSSIGRSDSDANYLYSQHAFLLLGNLDKSPLYSTIGINTIPFGVFVGSGPWDTPLTAAYFNPSQAPQLSLAFNKNGWDIAASTLKNQDDSQANYAYHLNYNKTIQDFSFQLGAGYFTNLNLSETMGFTNRSSIKRSIKKLARVGNTTNLGNITDLNGSISYGPFSLSAEYDAGNTKISDNKAKPAAYAVIANYVKTIKGKDLTFGISYSEAFHLENVPAILSGYDTLSSTLQGFKEAWAVNVVYEITKFTTLGLDLQKDIINRGLIKKSEPHTYTATLDLVVYL